MQHRSILPRIVTVLGCCAITILGGWIGNQSSYSAAMGGSRVLLPETADSSKETSKWDSTGWTGRVVVGEIYTGINCGYCQEHQDAFDSLIKRYPYTAFIPLEYHGAANVPIGNPADSVWERMWNWYGSTWHFEDDRFNHRIFTVPDSEANVPWDDFIDGHVSVMQPAGEFVRQETKSVDAELRRAPEAVLHVEATPKGEAIVAKVQVSSLAASHPDVFVRMLVVEDTVNLKITDMSIKRSPNPRDNRLNHYMVVRAVSRDVKDPAKYMVGTPMHGAGTVSYTFDMGKNQKDRLHCRSLALGEVQPKTQYDNVILNAMKLTGSAAFSDIKNWTMDPKRLHVVALVQDAHTGDVLQAQMVHVNAGPNGKLLKLPSRQ